MIKNKDLSIFEYFIRDKYKDYNISNMNFFHYSPYNTLCSSDSYHLTNLEYMNYDLEKDYYIFEFVVKQDGHNSVYTHYFTVEDYYTLQRTMKINKIKSNKK